MTAKTFHDTLGFRLKEAEINFLNFFSNKFKSKLHWEEKILIHHILSINHFLVIFKKYQFNKILPFSHNFPKSWMIKSKLSYHPKTSVMDRLDIDKAFVSVWRKNDAYGTCIGNLCYQSVDSYLSMPGNYMKITALSAGLIFRL